MGWLQIFVKHNEGPIATKIAVEHAEPALMAFGAVPKRPPPGDEILLEDDGTAQIRLYNPAAKGVVKRVLSADKLVIDSEIEYE